MNKDIFNSNLNFIEKRPDMNEIIDNIRHYTKIYRKLDCEKASRCGNAFYIPSDFTAHEKAFNLLRNCMIETTNENGIDGTKTKFRDSIPSPRILDIISDLSMNNKLNISRTPLMMSEDNDKFGMAVTYQTDDIINLLEGLINKHELIYVYSLNEWVGNYFMVKLITF